ncbi:MAG: polymer-forming cytoskeletal protein [Pseudomonadota bacterium]
MIGSKNDRSNVSTGSIQEPTIPSANTSTSSHSKNLSHIATPAAVIGPKIRFKGELVGEEDLLIQGTIEGTIDLKNNNLTIGEQGIIKANAKAKTIIIEGKVDGDLRGAERIVIKESSNVTGNLVAERVSLEDGAKFRGSIDMDTNSNVDIKSSPTSTSSAKAEKGS